MKRCAIYCRVSTADQTNENQYLEIRKFAKHHEDWGIVQEYEDVGISGATHDRQGLDRLKADCAKGKFDILIVWKFDRLARSTSHLLEILELLRRHEIDFVSVTENIDTTSKIGKMVLTFLGAVGEFEREIIKERVNAGLSRARANNVKLGRPRVGVDIQRALALRQQGLGYKQVASQLGVQRTTLYRYLQAIPKTLSA